ncbi:pyrroline-5-carboxylate reductase family protein [Acinetobacter rathckeae]|uniref:pyrroline-5-carboxylate reductase family protein n=1 Tax=Acinetobacter rathckeae TaxID=2605272 RepID=UPI0018A260DB|nr:pyrroline-5-carboxylate reductase [Acinetobacter rathckeae]MBF7686779.1 pyrroline-5-carboxylate reductase [Acinetobacter rathckeae]MBF7695689.1 pyrroline-5-carboxylate reductase [Acinetobacter rathckeae]
MSIALSCNVGFLGGGGMAQALIGGLLSRGLSSEQIKVADTEPHVYDVLQEKHIYVSTDYLDALQDVDVVVIALELDALCQILPSIAPYLKDKLILSLQRCVEIDTLVHLLATNRVVRAVSNLPAFIQTGAHGMYAKPCISEADKALATQVIASTGLVVWVASESDLNIVSAVSGSGSAYFFYMMESMIRAGRNLGLDEKTATALTLQTALGAAQMAISSGLSPTDLRKNLISAQGETRAALEVFDQLSVSQSIQIALAAAQKSSEVQVQQLSDHIKSSN